MRWEGKGLFLTATGVHLPERVPVAPAVTDGRYDQKEAESTRMIAYTHATNGDSSLEYAARAGRAALAETPERIRAELRVLYHTFSAPPGGPIIGNATSKLHELLTLGHDVRPLGVTNGCSMGLVALEDACYRLSGDPSGQPGAALIVASEVWPEEIVNPLTASRGLILADGAAAVIVTNIEPGFASILATESLVESNLSGATLGADPFAFDPLANVDLGARFDWFHEHHTPRDTYRRVRDDLARGVSRRALSDAGVTLDQIDAFILTHSGAGNLRTGYYRLLPGASQRTTTERIGLGTGHVGTADWFIGLHTLHTQGALKPGNFVLIVGGAAGWIETAVVLRMEW